MPGNEGVRERRLGLMYALIAHGDADAALVLALRRPVGTDLRMAAHLTCHITHRAQPLKPAAGLHDRSDEIQSLTAVVPFDSNHVH